MPELPSIEFRVGSDVARDGMFIERDLVDGAHRRTVYEILYFDHLGNVSFTAYERVELPLERMEEFISAARVRLPCGAQEPVHELSGRDGESCDESRRRGSSLGYSWARFRSRRGVAGSA
jgi:hypothetical protein